MNNHKHAHSAIRHYNLRQYQRRLVLQDLACWAAIGISAAIALAVILTY
jgi:hypothetical protein